MLPATPPSLLVLVLLQGSPAAQPPSVANCEDVERVELSLASNEVVQEICVSPGLMTGFLFDAPASVDLQDEVRFVEVIRGRGGISFVPPKDMALGERLRLTVRFGEGESQQGITFMLVAHRGQATRQVEVYRDPRTRESYRQEVEQERARNQKLLEENQRLRAQFVKSGGLRGLFLDGVLEERGIPVKEVLLSLVDQHSNGTLSVMRCNSFRSAKSVAVQIWVINSGAEPWTAEGASMVTVTGEKLEGIRIGQVEAIQPHQARWVFVEADAARGEPRGDVTLRLWGEGDRAISISKVRFP